ncbi:MAG: mechanosensitive ion channel [Spirulina sp. SIO3F2]|nr:mechanosensitive ion channel [Spirulina sp. SIO3F2]
MSQPRLKSLLALAIALILLLWLPLPSHASSVKAPVVLDGHVLFSVGESGNFTAQERAAAVNRTLAAEARSTTSPEIRVVQEEGLTILRSGDRYLLTVTENDLQNAAWPSGQGRIWRKQLQHAIERAQRERTATYQRQMIGLMVAMFLGSLLLLVIVRQSTTRLSRHLMQAIDDPSSPLSPWAEPASLFVRILRWVSEVGLAIGLLCLISEQLPQTRTWRYRFFQLWSDPLVPVNEGVSKSIADLVMLVLISLGLWFSVSILSRWFKMSISRRMGRESSTYEVIATLVQYSLVLLGLLIVLPLWGINLSSLAILGSFLGVGLGFGVQNIINNFVSGLIIAIERPIKVGDFVTVGNFQGTVTQIGSRSTQIRTQAQVTIIVPNSRFLDSEVINRSHDDTISRLHIPVGVAYNSPIALVRKALLESATQHREVLLRPEPQVWFMEFGDNSLNFELLVWTVEPKEQRRIKSDLNYRIEANLRKYNIEVPFPQRDLNVRSPQLQTLVNTILQQQGVEIAPEPPLETSDGEALAFLDVAPELSSIEQFSSRDIEQLVAAMRGPEGIDISDRRYRFNMYPRCFIGSEAVTWLMQYHDCCRESAVAIGQMLGDRGIVHHISDDHPFKDAYLFYRFYADE